MRTDYSNRPLGFNSHLALALGLILVSAPWTYSQRSKRAANTVVNEPVEWDKFLVKRGPRPIIRLAVAHQHAAAAATGEASEHYTCMELFATPGRNVE